MKRILWFIGLALSVQLAAVGLAQYPRTLTDDLGRSVTLKAAPKRLVVMLPSLTETICAMGACGRIVGVDTYSNFPEAVNKLPKVGGLYDPNLEAILALKPDLVLISVYGKLQEPLEKAGVPTFALKIESYDDIARTTRLLGQILNLRSEAERLIAKIQAQVYAVEAKAAATKDRPTVYYEIDPTPYTAGPDSFIGVLIAKARGVNIIPKELGAFPQISPELVVQKNPDVIVLTHPGLADLKKRPGWSGIKAVKTGRICDFSSQADDDLLSRPGPRVAQGLQLLVTCFHGK
ncbi:ABC transporter substrate-binding protein [Meiothermus granaticius]|uniref:Vitamin B12-binding protein n=1 Tax=Meiothermus granaticius NBRC 107808 TaxID=1227551 RepID=A0A399F6G7_9DEIN|nr:ABC transporter substrate-binding protein [Meiothermus granaticius]RIH91216.1 Vitamin B12-binding protein [Meiothermus granaticius NBRC 107808]GEM87065.1 ABC transporter substrate-binding protein [Meiothermus granaticius NBRC 107808]